MKKLTLLGILAVCLPLYITISGYVEGPAVNGYDCTGAETGLSNPTGCYAGSGCHATHANTSIHLTVELDSNGSPVTHYVSGGTYTIKITGVNNTSFHLPKFGFQLGAIFGSSAQVTPHNAGAFQTPYPTYVHYKAPLANNYVVGLVEHDYWLNPSSGTGGSGTTYTETIHWRAPWSTTDTVSFWAALNAVNDDSIATIGDMWNVAHIVIPHEGPLSIDNITEANDDIRVYPNPSNGLFQFKINNYELGIKNVVEVYNMIGEKIYTQSNIQNATFSIDLKGNPAGIYLYSITTEQGNVATGRIIIE
jgi:hypothetical protein